WLLAVAAYNCGEGCIGRAVKRNQELGLPADYWNLQLPSETMDYVPRLLALAQIVSTPEQFGISLPDLNDEPYFAQITIRPRWTCSRQPNWRVSARTKCAT